MYKMVLYISKASCLCTSEEQEDDDQEESAHVHDLVEHLVPVHDFASFVSAL